MNKRMLQIFGLSLLLLTPSTGNIKMIKDHNGNTPTNPPPCLLTCAGSTGYGTTTWTGNPGSLTTTVDISECQFVTTPIVTTSLNGAWFNDLMVGVSSPRRMTKDKFNINVRGLVPTAYSPGTNYKPTTADASEFAWNIHWIAVGFVC